MCHPTPTTTTTNTTTHPQGVLTKIYIDGSKRKPQERYMHLLSDALIYSSKMIGPYKYKVRHAMCVYGPQMTC